MKAFFVTRTDRMLTPGDFLNIVPICKKIPLEPWWQFRCSVSSSEVSSIETKV